MRYMRPDGSYVDANRDDWKAGFDDSATSSGLVCLTCYALLAPKKSFAEGHRQWHETTEKHGEASDV